MKSVKVRFDAETGLYYLQSRYYNQEWERLINADAIAGSVGELLGHNIFEYCKNNVVNMSDPSGFGPKFDTDQEESEYYEWKRSQSQVVKVANAGHTPSKINQYVNAVINNTAEEIKENKAKKSAQAIVVATGTNCIKQFVKSKRK